MRMRYVMDDQIHLRSNPLLRPNAFIPVRVLLLLLLLLIVIGCVFSTSLDTLPCWYYHC